MAHDHLQRLLHQAADLGGEPVADVPAIVERARRAQRRRRALRVGGIAMVALLAGFAVAAADTEPPEGVTTADGQTERDDSAGFDPAEPSHTEGTALGTETTTTTEDQAPGEVVDGDPSTTTTAVPRGSLQLAVSTSVLAPYAHLSIRSGDPCPAGPGPTRIAVSVVGIGGSEDGSSVGGDEVAVDPDGHWSVAVALAAVGGVANVAWAATAPELEVRASCRIRDVRTADYTPVRIRHGQVVAVPDLRATWEGQTATIRFSGCPTDAVAYLTVGSTPPPSGKSFPPPAAVGDASRGADPDTWNATIALPGYDPSDGLWASASCTDSSGATEIWRSLPFELDPPG